MRPQGENGQEQQEKVQCLYLSPTERRTEPRMLVIKIKDLTELKIKKIKINSANYS